MLFEQQGEWLDIDDGKLYWHPHFLDANEADDLFQTCYQQLAWRQESITLFGNSVLQPRLQAWYGDACYQYSGLMMQPLPWPDFLLTLKQRCEAIADTSFNSVLANLYRNGQDSMGYHQDNEPELGHQPIIASVSVGEQRRFTLKHLTTKQTYNLELTHGSLLIMAGNLQHYWKHALPKTQRFNQPRINLTYRNILTSKHLR
ncbi:alpha-ketoglutarate-dependent dioxygenase AlkB family protein [Vibrio olivae]|uniref:Alpha-ketoglutarate-dependent dioxygenase AlkB n=1 Tax=Vibrio olivae TaxID=1243002 RepID=A0ABV5HNH4_9VIBR